MKFLSSSLLFLVGLVSSSPLIVPIFPDPIAAMIEFYNGTMLMENDSSVFTAGCHNVTSFSDGMLIKPVAPFTMAVVHFYDDFEECEAWLKEPIGMLYAGDEIQKVPSNYSVIRVEATAD